MGKWDAPRRQVTGNKLLKEKADDRNEFGAVYAVNKHIRQKRPPKFYSSSLRGICANIIPTYLKLRTIPSPIPSTDRRQMIRKSTFQ